LKLVAKVGEGFEKTGNTAVEGRPKWKMHLGVCDPASKLRDDKGGKIPGKLERMSLRKGCV